jgi:hypothetical protein
VRRVRDVAEGDAAGGDFGGRARPGVVYVVADADDQAVFGGGGAGGGFEEDAGDFAAVNQHVVVGFKNDGGLRIVRPRPMNWCRIVDSEKGRIASRIATTIFRNC